MGRHPRKWVPSGGLVQTVSVARTFENVCGSEHFGECVRTFEIVKEKKEKKRGKKGGAGEDVW